MDILHHLPVSADDAALGSSDASGDETLGHDAADATVHTQAGVHHQHTFFLNSAQHIQRLLAACHREEAVHAHGHTAARPSVGSLQHGCLAAELLLTHQHHLRSQCLQLLFHSVHDGSIVIHAIRRKLVATAHAHQGLTLQRMDKGLSLGDIFLVVNIQNLVDRISLQLQALHHQLALEVAHAAHALLHAMVEYIQRLVAQAIDATRNQMVVALLLVVEARDARLLVGTLLVEQTGTLGIRLLLHANPQRLFIIHVWGNCHTSVNIFRILKVTDILFELLLTEDGIHGGETETLAPEIRREGMQTVHGTRSGLHHQAQRHWQLHLLQMFTHRCAPFVDNHNNFRGTAIYEDAQKALYHGFATQWHQWFRLFHALLCQSASLACGNNCKSHSIFFFYIQVWHVLEHALFKYDMFQNMLKFSL